MDFISFALDGEQVGLWEAGARPGSLWLERQGMGVGTQTSGPRDTWVAMFKSSSTLGTSGPSSLWASADSAVKCKSWIRLADFPTSHAMGPSPRPSPSSEWVWKVVPGGRKAPTPGQADTPEQHNGKPLALMVSGLSCPRREAAGREHIAEHPGMQEAQRPRGRTREFPGKDRVHKEATWGYRGGGQRVKGRSGGRWL